METKTDFAIIGGGPAGLAAASYGARAGMDTTVFEALGAGGQIVNIDRIENYPGFGEGISGWELASRFEEQARGFGARFVYAEIAAVERRDGLFAIVHQGGVCLCKAVLLATGAVHRNLGVPGEEDYRGHGVSYCATCDGPFFRGKRILAVGGGDTAVQESLYLSTLTDRLTVIHRRDRFRAQQRIVDRLTAKENVAIRLSTVLQEIKGDGSKVVGAVLRDTRTGEVFEEGFDAVFGFVGIVPRSELARTLGLRLDGAGYIETDQNMATSADGIFAAGDVRATPFRQVATACADGAVAAHNAQKWIEDLEGRSYEKAPMGGKLG